MNPIKYIVLFSFLTLIGCNNKSTETENQVSQTEVQDETVYVSKAQFENAKMSFGKISEQEFAQTVHTSGEIDVPPQNIAVISSFAGGYVKSTLLIIGDKVKKRDPLLRIENPEFIHMQQQYLENTEQLSYLKSEYDRQKTMLDENITSQKNYLKAESDYKTALARSNSLKKNLEMLHIDPASVLKGNIVSETTIYSPINGYVTQVLVNTGSYVSPADKIMEIINTEHLHLELKVFEKDLLQLKKGQEILFRVPEASKEYFAGDVHLIGTTIDPKSRTAKVHGHIENEEEVHFSVGMFVEADIITSTSTQYALPDDAVVEMDGVDYVLQLENEDSTGYHFRPVAVKVEDSFKGFTGFQTPLDQSATFLTKGGFVLLQSEEGDLE